MLEQSVHGRNGSAALVGSKINGSVRMFDVSTVEDVLMGFIYRASPLAWTKRTNIEQGIRTVAQ